MGYDKPLWVLNFFEEEAIKMKFYANLWLGSHKDTFEIEVWTCEFSLIDKNECKENNRIL